MLLSYFLDDSLWLLFFLKTSSFSFLSSLYYKVHKRPKLWTIWLMYVCVFCNLVQVCWTNVNLFMCRSGLPNILFSFFLCVHLTCSFWQTRQSQPSCSVFVLFDFPDSLQLFRRRPLIFISSIACFCPSTLRVFDLYIHSPRKNHLWKECRLINRHRHYSFTSTITAHCFFSVFYFNW